MSTNLWFTSIDCCHKYYEIFKIQAVVSEHSVGIHVAMVIATVLEQQTFNGCRARY